MNKRDYEKTNDYKKSIEILKGFVRDVLDGNIEKLKDFDFTDLTTYVGDNIDPDMYLITQAIYIILWGDIYDLTFEKMGSWTWNNRCPFRGDTMNSFGSLFGNEDKEKGREFAFEGIRRTDLVRFNKFVTTSWWDKTASNEPKRNIFPIPQRQLDANANLSPNEANSLF